MNEKEEHHHEGMSRRAWGFVLAVATWGVLWAAQQGAASPLARSVQELENKSLDFRFQLREKIAPTRADPSIVVLTIDQNGIDLFEHARLLAGKSGGEADPDIQDDLWPWKRAFYGSVAKYLARHGARAVFFDFMFTGRSVWDYDGFEEDDLQFAADCQEAGIVYQSILFEGQRGADEGARAEAQADPVHDIHYEILDALLEGGEGNPLGAAALDLAGDGVPEYDAVQVPIPPLVDGAAGLGAVNANFDSDGVIRRVGLLFRFRGKTYGSVQLSLARNLLAAPLVQRDVEGGKLQLGSTSIPIDSSGQMLINWHGPAHTYDTSPLHRIIIESSRVDEGVPASLAEDEFRDKIVLVGTSAAGLADLKATPLANAFPGVEVHATVLDNLLNDDFITRPSSLWQNLVTLVLFLLAGQLFLRRQSAALSFLLAGALLLVTVGATLWLFISQGTWIDLVVPVGGLGLLFSEAQTVQYFTEGKQKRKIRNAFQQYLPPTVVNEVLKLPADELRLGGERKQLTVSFSDIESFTTISEGLEPEQLVSMLNVYLSEMSDVVSRSGGTLDKYIGDCIMAFWGAPLPTDDGAECACLAALESQELLCELRRKFAEQGLPELRARIGINTGPMLVGNMGSESHFAYTVMGDAVNLASRLEGANKQYGTYLMLGEETYEEAKHAIEVRPLDLLKVKGKEHPVRVYELMAKKGCLSPEREELRETFCRGLELYRKKEWEAALVAFGSALELDPTDGPTKTYIERCGHFLRTPPAPDWDGVFTMQTK